MVMVGWYRICKALTMRSLARGLLVVVVLFVLALAGTLYAKSRTLRTESVGPAPGRADLTIKDVEVEEAAKGGVHWRLKAEQAQAFNEEGRTLIRQLVLTVDEPERSWTIVGDEGDIFQADKNVEVRRNVVVTSTDGLRLETSVLRWEGAKQRLWTDAPVVISREGSVIRGSGLEVLMNEEQTTVAGRVRAVFASPSSQ
jgi:LPS export ABC transporter protein LptC